MAGKRKKRVDASYRKYRAGNTWLSVIFIFFTIIMLIVFASLFAAAFIAGKTHSLFTKQSVIRGEQTSFIDEMVGNEKIIRENEKLFGKVESLL